ncbi:MAG: hypothetical protein IM631_19245 [Cytophagales bacterium]|nr:hypothetical protein [Cytophagales bacterium]MCA6373510.1 hypothetical protein [Cytophagales bacterium]MCA6375487.1 hypothetical protein [Cytophagales bacterium]MCA6385361.1 hypothetical protein [Cytophagales bacterium]
MKEVDELIDKASARWYAYGVLFGKHKVQDGSYATVVISLYKDKYTPIQKKFKAPTLALAVEQVKEWLATDKQLLP